MTLLEWLQSMSMALSLVEPLLMSVWHTAFCDTFSGEVFQNILSEFINRVVIFFLEVSWDDSAISFFPLSIIMVVSYEPIKLWVEALETWLGFFNLTDLSHMVELSFLWVSKSLMENMSWSFILRLAITRA
jgi:hypothetical protein